MKLKILQWNIYYKENIEKVADEILKINPDIICLQELIQNTNIKPTVDTGNYLKKNLKYFSFIKETETWSNRSNKTAQLNAIFSRYPITNTSYQYLSPLHHNPPDANFEGRVYIEATIKINQIDLTVGTTHLSFSPQFIINERRKKEVDNLAKILVSKKNNYIFTGDLNAVYDSYAIKTIEKYLVHAGPNYLEPTWTTKPFDYHGQFKEDKLRWRLDYIFKTKDIKVVDSKILKTPLSDHLPILATIDI